MSMALEGKSMSWKQAQRLYGPIKRGQVWQKIDTKRAMRIDHPKGSGWAVTFLEGSSKCNHSIDMRTIYRYYELVKK